MNTFSHFLVKTIIRGHAARMHVRERSAAARSRLDVRRTTYDTKITKILHMKLNSMRMKYIMVASDRNFTFGFELK